MSGDVETKRSVSFFEFWPAWVFYTPVVVQWLGLAIWHRSLTVPFLANPSLALSGMVGVPKSELMVQASGKAKDVILPWIKFDVDGRSAAEQAQDAVAQAAEEGIELPFVCKPDIGCRGAGVKRVTTVEKLATIIESYPVGAPLLCQKLAQYEPEVGIFYVKNPTTGVSHIESMTLKHLPSVTGDGVKTLGQLVADDERAGQLLHLYQERHQERWDAVPAADEVVKLVFSASHCRGAVFQDVRGDVTPELTQAIDAVMQGLPDFYYGRLDVKFKDMESLKRGETMEVIEINGASAESIHIWDKDATFGEAIRALLWQYRTLFKIGVYHRKQGKKVPSLREFWTRWQHEKRLTQHYPLTD